MNASLIYKDFSLTFNKFYEKDNSVCIHQRNLQKLALEIIKVKNNLAPDIMTALFFSNKSDIKYFNTRCVLYGTELSEKSGIFRQLLRRIPHQ